MVRAIRLSIEAVDRRLEQAGATLGASPLWVFATITLPLIAPGIVAGAILSFARAMGEFGATITFVSNIPGETQTLPTLIYTFTQVPGGDAAALRLTLISLALSLAAIIASEAIAQGVTEGCMQHEYRGICANQLGDFGLEANFKSDARATAIFGPSGAGKTSVINVIAGLLRPRRGRVVVDGAVLLDTEAGIFLPAHRRRVGYVFQESRLFPHLSVRRNLLYGRFFASRQCRKVYLPRSWSCSTSPAYFTVERPLYRVARDNASPSAVPFLQLPYFSTDG